MNAARPGPERALVGGSARWMLTVLAVAGSVLLMAAVAVGAAASVHIALPGRLPTAEGLAWGMAATGMACGAVLAVAGAAGGRRASRHERVPGGVARAAGSPEEWLAFMRPDGAGPAPAPGGAVARGPGSERAGA